MFDLIIIGAGPGGIALAAEACASGINHWPADELSC
jgi:pyruvate/2-oxoglutarate dehydrogenase complex dihydrolipoamide dehydrogenase (E3) component